MPIDIEKIKALRDKLGLTMDQAATAAGFKSRQLWNGIETGTRKNVTIETLEKVAKALGVKGKDLLK